MKSDKTQQRKSGWTQPRPESRRRECLPCDLPPFCRNHYFTGKLLTERDFLTEQRYSIDKLRLHHLALHGWGVVCGLKVKPHPYCPERRMVVEPGLAIDAAGREIRILREWEVELPELPTMAPPSEQPCPPEPGVQDDAGSGPSEPGEPPRKEKEPTKSGYEQGAQYKEKPHQPPPEPCPPEPKKYTLYFCLRYSECETEFMVAPFDDCACGGNERRPARICESYDLEILTEPPPIIKHLHEIKERCKVDDCESLYRTALERCPQPECGECVILAVVSDYVPGQPVTEDMIDNWTYRMTLPSVSMLDRLIRCILDKLPTHTLTRIEDYNWDHDHSYPCHNFMEEFVGDEKSPRQFEIWFERPIFQGGLTRRTFEATVVRYPEQGGPRHPEVVPATVGWGPGNRSVYLRIDHRYARTLHNSRFDLYLRLRCDLLVDLHGRPVDGELQAILNEDNYDLAPYTGDGIPGGLFESWIRVS